MATLSGWAFCPRCAARVEGDAARLSCPSCGAVYYAESAPAVSALVADAQGNVLLARRAFDPDAGLWDVPGGFLEEGEHPLDALRRELLEETGVSAEPGAFVGVFVDTYGDGPEANAVLNLAWEVRWFAPEALPPDEELAFGWIAPALRAWLARSAP